mmetsp:Transcript_2861/g.6133  ORF Transcript_2861/g.6133 Transcript_2861/m.6133 type:complete len:255 (+) Transcript_2861:143-907(+)
MKRYTGIILDKECNSCCNQCTENGNLGVGTTVILLFSVISDNLFSASTKAFNRVCNALLGTGDIGRSKSERTNTSTKTSGDKGGFRSDIVPIAVAVFLSVALIEVTTVHFTALDVAIGIIESIDGEAITGISNDGAGACAGPLSGHFIVGTDFASVIGHPPVGFLRSGNAHGFEVADWGDVVVILMHFVRMSVARVIGPSLLVSVQKHAIAHEANNVILNFSGITWSAGFLGDHHGVMLVHGVICSGRHFRGLL